MDAVRIRRAQQGDREAVRKLLQAYELPVDGLDECWGSAFVAYIDSAMAGCAALELHGPDAVLRSVAVDSAHRGRGIGEALVRRALDTAQSNDVRDVYLLTETASDFFPRFGFRETPREQAPPAILESIEYSSLCPASATSMVRRVDGDD